MALVFKPQKTQLEHVASGYGRAACTIQAATAERMGKGSGRVWEHHWQEIDGHQSIRFRTPETYPGLSGLPVHVHRAAHAYSCILARVCPEKLAPGCMHAPETGIQSKTAKLNNNGAVSSAITVPGREAQVERRSDWFGRR
jgi:hypothetical protein